MQQRFRFDLAYNGKPFFGWQRQPKQHSVQAEIENCLFKLYQTDINVVGCGRTDTGVHAHFYVLHVDLDNSRYSVDDLLYKMNKMLPESIVIYSIKEVFSEFHARFDAKERTYRYFIHHQKNPFLTETSLLLHQYVDFEMMNVAAQNLIGKKDFTSFSKLHTDVYTNICDVKEAKWIEYESGRWYFQISADRFLRNMVRATVGTLLEVGYGKLDVNSITTILEKKDRCEAKTSVSAHALFLWDVKYP
jgi:tRNA pseudouridine38-40 synthase